MKKIFALLFCAAFVSLLAGCTSQSKELPMVISQDEWADSKQFVELSTGIKMAYVEMGNPDGPAIILQHGMTDNSRSWSLAAPFFANAGYHVYLPDLRGMGKSDAPDGYYTPVTYATDLKAFFDAKKIDKAIMVGHSLGSYTVQAFSIMFPEKVEKLVLVSSLPMKGYQNQRLVTLYEKFVEPLAENEHPSSVFMDVWYKTTIHEEEYSDIFDEFLSNMKKEAQALSKKAWVNILFGMTVDNFTECYSQIDKSIPVLILHGNEDEMAQAQYQEELCSIFGVSQSSYRNYAGIGHNIQFEIPRECATDILTWIDTGSLPE